MDDVAGDGVAEAVEGVYGDAAHFGGAGEVSVDVGLADFGEGGEDDVVGAVGDLRLAPGMGFQFFAEFPVGNDDEFPRLQAIGGGGEDKRFLERIPKIGRDGFGWIEGFGGVAPVEMGEEGGGGDGW